MASLKGDNLVGLTILVHLKSCMIRGLVFGGKGLIRGLVFGGKDLVRWLVFGGKGLVRGLVFGGKVLIRGVTLLYIAFQKVGYLIKL